MAAAPVSTEAEVSALLRVLRGRGQPERQSWPTLSMDDYASFFGYGGMQYPFMSSGTLQQEKELPPNDFLGYAHQLYRSNGVIFACMAVRQRIFTEARFQLQRYLNGTPGDLFGSSILAPLERPWGPSSTTGDLLARMIQDVDLAGNSFTVRSEGGRLARARPDWVTIVVGSRTSPKENPNWQLDAEVVGYIYQPGGPAGDTVELIMPENMAHWAPYPDPMARWRGMSWLTPVLRETMADSAAMTHKLKFFENGATPNIVVSLGENVTPDNFRKFVNLFEAEQTGVSNAYKTLFFGGGASVQVIGSDLRQIDFKSTQGHGETRIAAAAGVPAIIAGLSEGLENATYSNFAQARRAFADLTMRPLWRDAAASLETLIDLTTLPGGGVGARLWYDDRHIPFVQDDIKDAAEVQQLQSVAIKQLIDAGFKPDDVVTAITSNDLARLKGAHTGLVSVQLFKPGEGPTKAGGFSAGNGTDNGNDGSGNPVKNGNTKPQLPSGNN